MKSSLCLVSALCTSFAHPLRWTAFALPIVAHSLLGTPALANEPASQESTAEATPAATSELTPAEAALTAADLLDQLAAELRGTATPTPAPAPASPLLLSPADRLNPELNPTLDPTMDPALSDPAADPAADPAVDANTTEADS